MKERVKLKGVVSARNAKTGEVIFENLQNTIVLGGCITALSKIAGVTQAGDIYIQQSKQPAGYSHNLETSITGYNFEYVSGGNVPPNVSPVDKEYDNTDCSDENHVFDAPVPVAFFDGEESYRVADIPEGAADKKIVVLEEGCLSFIRYKLTLKNSLPGNVEEPDPTVIQNHADGDITYVNSIELFSETDGQTMLFSKLNFPAIPFFGSLAIDFEYRIYL